MLTKILQSIDSSNNGMHYFLHCRVKIKGVFPGSKYACKVQPKGISMRCGKTPSSTLPWYENSFVSNGSNAVSTHVTSFYICTFETKDIIHCQLQEALQSLTFY